MTPEQFRQRMHDLSTSGRDEESTHYEADEMMCELLRTLGYGEGVEIFERMTKWYA